MAPDLLLAVPNVSEGEDAELLDRLAAAFGRRAEILDRSADAGHGRAVFTLAAAPADLGAALLEGAEVAIEAIDLSRHRGAHPRVGVLDVCPVVYLDPGEREAARALALDLASRLGALGLPVFLYGELATSEPRRERHFFRRGGSAELAQRLAAGELAPDYGPARLDLRSGAVLVTARPPLAAFNVEVEGTGLAAGQRIAAALRESGGGPPGVRAIAIDRDGDRVQISTNVHDPVAVPLARVIAEVERIGSPLGARVAGAELIGLVPEAALVGLAERRDPGIGEIATRTIESRLAALR